jgi:chromosomal replication initiator protein
LRVAVSVARDSEVPGEVNNAWARIRKNLRESAGARLFEQWLKPIELGDSDDATMVCLTLPSAFTANWVRNHYADRLAQEFRAAIPEIRTVSIDVRAATSPAVLRVAASESPVAGPAPVAVADRPALDPRLTFDRFVVDPSNRVAFNAARALAEPGVPRFSPLFLHSGTGLGKTHLMHAIGHAFLTAVPDAKVILLSAERFMFEFVAAMRANDTHAFKARLRSADLLMVDDLHFISGKTGTQDEFFHTINELTAAGKRLVITADRCPHGLDDVEARIVSRLSMGLVADIKAPDIVLRRALLDHRVSELDGVKVPNDVLDMLAGRISSSLREVEGALNRLIAYAQLTGDAIDMDFAQATLGDVLRGATKRITIDEIQRAVSIHFDLKPVDLVSARRAVVVARPRQIAMYLAKRLTTRSLPEIGRKFGGRDHSTVIHAVRRIEELRGSDHEIDGAVRSLIRQLEG